MLSEWRSTARRRLHGSSRLIVEHTPESDRDRLWALLVQRYGLVRRIGYYFHGDDFDEVVPPLGSRARPARVTADAEPTPVPAPTPA